EKRGDHLECSIGLPRLQYVVAVASDEPIVAVPPSIYIETSRIGFLREPEADGATHLEVEALRTELQDERAAHDQAISALTSEKTAADARIGGLQKALDGTAARIGELERALEAARTATAARTGELERALDTARAVNAALERACERAEETSDACRQQLAECRECASQQEARVAELLSSNSWRITAPLRTVFGPLRRR